MLNHGTQKVLNEICTSAFISTEQKLFTFLLYLFSIFQSLHLKHARTCATILMTYGDKEMRAKEQ